MIAIHGKGSSANPSRWPASRCGSSALAQRREGQLLLLLRATGVGTVGLAALRRRGRISA